MSIMRSFFSRPFAAALIVCTLAGAPAAFAAQPAHDQAGMQAVAQFRITDQVMTRYLKVFQGMMNLAKAHPEWKDEANPKTLDEMVQRLDSKPQIRTVLAGAGMSAREYALCSLALIQAGIYSGLVKMQGEKAWSRIPAGAPAENTRYVIAHPQQMKQLKDIEREAEGAGDSGGGG